MDACHHSFPSPVSPSPHSCLTFATALIDPFGEEPYAPSASAPQSPPKVWGGLVAPQWSSSWARAALDPPSAPRGSRAMRWLFSAEGVKNHCSGTHRNLFWHITGTVLASCSLQRFPHPG